MANYLVNILKNCCGVISIKSPGKDGRTLRQYSKNSRIDGSEYKLIHSLDTLEHGLSHMKDKACRLRAAFTTPRLPWEKLGKRNVGQVQYSTLLT